MGCIFAAPQKFKSPHYFTAKPLEQLRLFWKTKIYQATDRRELVNQRLLIQITYKYVSKGRISIQLLHAVRRRLRGRYFRHGLKPNRFSKTFQTEGLQSLKTSRSQNQERDPELSLPKQSVKNFDTTNVLEILKINDSTIHLLALKRTEANRMLNASQFEIHLMFC